MNRPESPNAVIGTGLRRLATLVIAMLASVGVVTDPRPAEALTSPVPFRQLMASSEGVFLARVTEVRFARVVHRVAGRRRVERRRVGFEVHVLASWKGPDAGERVEFGPRHTDFYGDHDPPRQDGVYLFLASWDSTRGGWGRAGRPIRSIASLAEFDSLGPPASALADWRGASTGILEVTTYSPRWKGRPAERADLRLRHLATGRTIRAQSDDNSRAVFSRLEPGAWSLWASHRHHGRFAPDTIQVLAGQWNTALCCSRSLRR